MNPTSRPWMAAVPSAFVVVVTAGFLGLFGCNPHKDQLRPGNIFQRIGRTGGQIIEPRKCVLRVAILNRAFRDQAINEVVWKVADEQATAPEARRALEVNGLRIGRITGELPAELERVLSAPPPHKVDAVTYYLFDGEDTLIIIADPVDQVSLLMNRENRPFGKDYQAASGFFRVSASHDGNCGVSLRFTPEIHHGPIQHSFQPISNATPYSAKEFRVADGQQEEALRDLTASLLLEPGQVAVIGCQPAHERSLGSFLFTQAQAHSDQRRQKLILVWAGRNQQGALGDTPQKADRPSPSSSSATGMQTGANQVAMTTNPSQNARPSAKSASNSDSR
ncbi:MAG TPA: hypothetical protein VJY33_23785 [Isosphaeraceae bacterium]|nr:hypothetical protein [Isosphaeraceae bacterium]